MKFRDLSWFVCSRVAERSTGRFGMPVPTLISCFAHRPDRASGVMLLAAWMVVVSTLLQFLFAGLALFQDGSMWACHVGLGFSLSLLILSMTIFSFSSRTFAHVRGWLALLSLAYFLQICLIWITKSHGLSLPQAIHPFNGSLILVVALTIARKLSSQAAVLLAAR